MADTGVPKPPRLRQPALVRGELLSAYATLPSPTVCLTQVAHAGVPSLAVQDYALCASVESGRWMKPFYKGRLGGGIITIIASLWC